MIKKIVRDLYLLPRGEQRALILLSLLLILGIIVRASVQLLPERTPPGMEQFVQESRAIMAALEQEDSLNRSKNQYPGTKDPDRSPQLSPININTADSIQLLPLPGIGPVYAGRIIKYRNLLGGFAVIDQLYEVYGLKEETIRLIGDHIKVDSTAIRKINLDSASFRKLLRHPYLQLEDVKALVNYRDFRGRIGSFQEVRDNNLLPDSTLKKISPYIQFNY